MRRLLRPALIAATLLLASAAPAGAMLLATQSDSSVYRTGVDDAGALRYLRTLDSVGADAQRISLRWGTIAARCGTHTRQQRRDPALECYDWSGVDQAVGHGIHTRERRLEVYASVREPPCWLFGQPSCVGPAPGAGFVGSTPGQLERFSDELAAFLTAAAARYAPAGRAPDIRNWTVWTEPNSDYFWSELRDGTAARQPPIERRGCHFAHVYAAAVQAIRADPRIGDVRIAFGPYAPGPSVQPLAHLRAALAVGADQQPFACGRGAAPLVHPGLVGALAIHPYPFRARAPWHPCESWIPGSSWRERGMSLQCVDDLRAALDDPSDQAFAAVRGAPLWALETAYEDAALDPGRGVEALTQALWLPAALHRLWAAGAEVASWYPAVDGGDVADWQSGLLTSNVLTRRPAYLTFQAPVSIRVLDDGQAEVWARVRNGEPTTLLRAADCSDGEFVRLERAEVTRRDGAILARLPARELSGGACVTLGIDDDARPTASVTYGLSRDGSAHVTVARVVHDRLRDPRGDVVSSLDPAPTGNPTLGALLRGTFLGSGEPTRIDTSLTPLLAPSVS